jgi:hypothetical protein
MGCYSSKSSYETTLDGVFSTFPLRTISTHYITMVIDKNSELINNKQKVNNLTKDSYLTIIEKYCKHYQDKENSQYHFYWDSFYENKPENLKYFYIKFQFALLSKNREIDFKLYTKILEELRDFLTYKYNTDIKINKNSNKIKIEFLYPIIYDYIFSITNLAIEPFKENHHNPLFFVNSLNTAWSPEIISTFTKVKFFEKGDKLDTEVSIEDFLKKHLMKLINDILIRKELIDFYNKNKNENLELKYGKDYFSMEIQMNIINKLITSKTKRSTRSTKSSNKGNSRVNTKVNSKYNSSINTDYMNTY